MLFTIEVCHNNNTTGQRIDCCQRNRSHRQSLQFLSLHLWQIQGQLDKVLDDMSASLCTLKDGMSYTKQLPSKGLSQSQVLDKIREYETLSKCASSPDPPTSSPALLQGELQKKNWTFVFFLCLSCRWGGLGKRVCVWCGVLGWRVTDQTPSEG